MATRGARPKPSKLRVVDGTHRSSRHGQAEHHDEAFEPLDKPTDLAGPASDAWDRWVTPATWLDWTREPAAIAFCNLWAEFSESPLDFQSARHAQLRAYMNELGLTDERNRGGEEKKKRDPGERYFD